MEEQITRVHGEMASVKDELQRMGHLAVKVDMMLDKMLVLKRVE